MKPMRIHHVALRTRDVQRLEAFYAGLLGLARWRGSPERAVWLDAGGTILMIERASVSEPDIEQGTRELIAFAVAPSDRARLVALLLASGVAIEDTTPFTLYFRDPDGRRVGLSHYPEPAMAAG
jgi:glyoxylase I family protein